MAHRITTIRPEGGTPEYRSVAAVVLLSLCTFGTKQLAAAETDLFGDPLPAGAVARAGTIRSAVDLPVDVAMPPSMRGVVFSPDNKLLATRGAPPDSSAQRMIRIWDARTGELVRTLTAHNRPITALSFSADGRLLIASTPDHPQGTQVWMAETGRLVTSFPGGRGRFAVSADGKTLSIADRFQKNDVIRKFDVSTGHEVGRSVVDVSHWFEFSPDGRKFLSKKSDRTTTVRLMEINTGKPIAQLTIGDGSLGTVALAADGRTAAAAVSVGSVRSKTEHLIVVWELATRRRVFELAGHTKRVLAMGFTHDGRFLISGSADKTVRIWEVATGKEVHQFGGHRKPVSAIAISRDGTRVASGSLDRTALIWNLSAVRRSFLPQTPLDQDSLARVWDELAAASPASAYRAIGLLRENDATAAPFLRQQIESIVRPVQADRIRALIADLEHEDFVVRYRATEELKKLREIAKPILLKVIKQTTSAEVRYRVRRILTGAEHAPRFSTADVRRMMRVIHVLEYLPGKEAEATLQAIIDDFPSTLIVREAQETLMRLQNRRRRS